MALSKSVIHRIRKTSNHKTELVCRQELLPNSRDSSQNIYAILLTITASHRTYAIRIYDEYLIDLVKRSRFIISTESTDVSLASEFLSKYLPNRIQLNVADLITNYIQSNPIPIMQSMYYELLAHVNSANSAESPLIDQNEDDTVTEYDDIDKFIFDNAEFACRYMRQIYALTEKTHISTDPILVFDNWYTTSKKIGRGKDDYCWTDTFLSITYMRHTRDGKVAAEPWKISIKEKQAYTGNTVPDTTPEDHVVSLELSNNDFEEFINDISHALEMYHSISKSGD